MISARPSCQGSGGRFGIPKPSPKLRHVPQVCPQRRATWPNGEWGYSTRRHMLEPVRPEAVLPDRALCLPTFSRFLIVNKTSLSLSSPSTVSHPCQVKPGSRILSEVEEKEEEDFSYSTIL
jgi:hypothetical protein